MEFNVSMDRGLMGIKDNELYLFPIFKEAIITGSEETKKEFDKIKYIFNYFNKILKLSDKEVVDILISIMIDNEDNVFKSIFDSIPKNNRMFRENYTERVVKIKKMLRKLKIKILIEKNDIISKKRQKLEKKKNTLVDSAKTKRHEDFILNFTKLMMRYIDGTEKYELVKNAYYQLSMEGYKIFDELKKLGVCYNYETKVKMKDDHISIPFVMIYDSLVNNTSSEARFLSTVRPEDYIYIFMSIKKMEKIKEYEEVKDLMNAKFTGPFNYDYIFGELKEKIILIRDLINSENLLFKKNPDWNNSLSIKYNKITEKLIKLFENRISTPNDIYFSPKQLNIVLSESKKKILELNDIIFQNKQLIVENSKWEQSVIFESLPDSILYLFFSLDFKTEDNNLEELKEQFFKSIKKTKFSDSDFGKIPGIRDKRKADKLFDKIISSYENRFYNKVGQIYRSNDNVSPNGPIYQREKENMCNRLGINSKYCDIIFNQTSDDETIDNETMKQILLDPDFLISDKVDDILLPTMVVDYLKYWRFQLTINNYELIEFKDYSSWFQSLKEDVDTLSDEFLNYIDDNYYNHFNNLIKLINKNPGVLNPKYEETINYFEIIEQKNKINIPNKIFEINNDVKSEVETSKLFKNIDIYLTEKINAKLLEIGFSDLLMSLEDEFKNQIKMCLENNTTTLIPLLIIYQDSNIAHSNMISIHNNFVELAEPHGINFAISKRYDQIYNYLSTFIDPSKIKRIDNKFVKSSLMTANLQPQMFEPLCDAHANLFALFRILYPKLPFHEVYSMTFSKFPVNVDDFLESKDDDKIVKLNLPSEKNFYDRQYIMFDNLQQDRIIERLQNFILFNKTINDGIKNGVNLMQIISPRI